MVASFHILIVKHFVNLFNSDDSFSNLNVEIYHHDNHRYQEEKSRDDEHKEASVVAPTNTSVNPGTVVVKPIDTQSAHIAMPAPGNFDYLALRTEINCIHFFQELHEILVRPF